jgi:hypothetical protein
MKTVGSGALGVGRGAWEAGRKVSQPARRPPSAIRDLRFAVCTSLVGVLVWTAATAAAPLPPALQSELPKTATWQPSHAADVKPQVTAWAEKAKIENAVRAKIAGLWAGVPDSATGADLLEKLAESAALADASAAKLVEQCSKPRSQLLLPGQPWLADAKTPPLVAANLRLYYARWLVQNLLFDEAQEQLSGLKPGDVVAPAELLFYQGVVCHRLLNKDEGLQAIDQLLDGADASPRRYVAVARLMQADLGGLEPDTLDHIARRMDDIGRRLDLGRAGPKVRKVEDGVIESLDKLIKKIEEEQQKQQQQASQGQNRSTRPAERSTPMGGAGPGEVVKRNIGAKSGWGNMNPKEREEALQQIGREYPAEVRDIIEQYFRRLASEESNDNK